MKTNKKILEEIIRVDHAGERGAIKIYEGQLLALKTFRQDEDLKKQIEEMKEHEKEHYNFFRSCSLDKFALFPRSQTNDSLKKPCSIPKW